MLARISLLPDEHVYSGIVRGRYLSGQMHISNQRFFQINAIPYHLFRSQAPLCSNLHKIISLFGTSKQQRFNVRLAHTPLAPWLFSYEEGRSFEEVECSGNRNNLEENPFNTDRRWKFCPLCSVEQRKHFGVTYWQSPHQLPGARVCHIHLTELHSHDYLRYLDFSLPGHWDEQSSHLPIERAWQAEWQSFIYLISSSVSKNPSLIYQIKAEVYAYLGVTQAIKRSDKPKFDQFMSQMQVELGEECLSGLFRAYAKNGERKPNILWVTLSTFSSSKGIRPPLYWLSILFWLRCELPTLRRLGC